jgi:hypothetical protein
MTLIASLVLERKDMIVILEPQTRTKNMGVGAMSTIAYISSPEDEDEDQ